MTSALVVDDHPIVFQGCRRLLTEVGMVRITERRCLAGGYRSFLEDKPELVVTDLTFAEDDLRGLALIERIMGVDPSATVMVFTMHDDPSIVARSLALGARGYALKDSAAGDLIDGFRRVLRGEKHVDQQLAIAIADTFALSCGPTGLSAREAQILRMLGDGVGLEEIAERLGISYKTVANATAIMRKKLRLESYSDLLRHAKAAGGREI